MPCYDPRDDPKSSYYEPPENSTNSSSKEQLEIELCKCRDILLKVVEHSFDLPQELLIKVENERKKHLTHRKEDLQAYVKILKNKIQKTDDEKELILLSEELKMVLTIKDNQLLTNRELFILKY